MNSNANRSAPISPLAGIIAFLAVMLIGLAIVKWVPYYHKAFIAQSNHSIGNSIIAGTSPAAPAASWQAAVDYSITYGKAIWQALVLGLLLGSGIKVLIPGRWIHSLLGRMGLRSTVVGGLLGVPCMMCTCCAAPVTRGMRENSASVGGAVAWWLSNPVLNPATLIFMGFVLGWGWAAFRLVFGIAMVIGIAYLAERLASPETANKFLPASEPAGETSEQGNIWKRWAREFSTLAIRLLPEYLILVMMLGAARAWLFPLFDAPDTLGWIIAMAVTGMLFVIPTAGEVAIVQAMLGEGMGIGPAAALLITLPAVSVPSLAMLARAFDLKILLVIASGVALCGVAAGAIAILIF